MDKWIGQWIGPSLWLVRYLGLGLRLMVGFRLRTGLGLRLRIELRLRIWAYDLGLGIRL